MGFFGSMGKALGAPLRALPGGRALSKPLNKSPLGRAVNNRLGMNQGPSKQRPMAPSPGVVNNAMQGPQEKMGASPPPMSMQAPAMQQEAPEAIPGVMEQQSLQGSLGGMNQNKINEMPRVGAPQQAVGIGPSMGMKMPMGAGFRAPGGGGFMDQETGQMYGGGMSSNDIYKRFPGMRF